eukprot:g2689.t1
MAFLQKERWPSSWKTYKPHPDVRVVHPIDHTKVMPLGHGSVWDKIPRPSAPGIKPAVNTTKEPLDEITNQQEEVLLQEDKDKVSTREKLTKQIPGGLNRCRRIFLDCDADADGRVLRSTLSRALSSLDEVRLTKPEVDSLLSLCDPSCTGKVEYRKFVNVLHPTKRSVQKTEMLSYAPLLENVSKSLRKSHSLKLSKNSDIVAAIAMERADQLNTVTNDFGRNPTAERAVAAREKAMSTLDGSGTFLPGSYVARHRTLLSQGQDYRDVFDDGDLLYHSYSDAWKRESERLKEAEQLARKMPRAGLSTRKNGKETKFVLTNSASEALQWREQPATPERLAKFRKSGNKPLGRRRYLDSAAQPPAPPPQEQKKPKKETAETTLGLLKGSGCWPGNVPDASLSTAERTILNAKESSYLKCLDSRRRYPVGKALQRNPDLNIDPQQIHGKKSGAYDSENLSVTKNVLFPNDTDQKWAMRPVIHSNSEKKSRHGKIPVGIQRRRGYQFPDGVNGYQNLTFGETTESMRKKGSRKIGELKEDSPNKEPRPEGVAGCLQTYGIGPIDEHTFVVTKSQIEKWERGNRLGKVRVQGSTDFGRQKNNDRIAGIRTTKGLNSENIIPDGLYRNDTASAATVMRGNYSPMDQQPDVNLGRSTRQGYRNIPLPGDDNRVFGLPSHGGRKVRPAHLAPGDLVDVKTSDILHPGLSEPYGVKNVVKQDLERGRNIDEIRDVFEKIGYKFRDCEFADLVKRAIELEEKHGGEEGKVSIMAIRNAINENL